MKAANVRLVRRKPGCTCTNCNKKAIQLVRIGHKGQQRAICSNPVCRKKAITTMCAA